MTRVVTLLSLVIFYLASCNFAAHNSPLHHAHHKVSGRNNGKTSSSLAERTPTTYKNAVYFMNWGIYGRKFQPQNLTQNGMAKQLTHVLYAFANVDPSSGEVYMSDIWADYNKTYPTDPTDAWNDTGKNVYGCVKQLYILKKHNRQLKTLLSIGGWTYSSNLAQMASQNSTRTKFADSSVNLLANLGFDGLDIDWEYPADDGQAKDMVSLLKAVRGALDGYASSHNLSCKFLLTVASPAGPVHYNTLHLKEMDQYLTQWNLMGYDYAGNFSNATGHQANVYPNPNNTDSTPFSTNGAVKDYIAAGVDASRIILGAPIYGRAFDNTKGLGLPFNGYGNGSWPPNYGIWDYKDLPKPGATEVFDFTANATYSYDANANGGELITYDNKDEIVLKVNYLKSKGLGGMMFWEASADKLGNDSLIATAAASMGSLDDEENCLSYPVSQYENMKQGMPGE